MEHLDTGKIIIICETTTPTIKRASQPHTVLSQFQESLRYSSLFYVLDARSVFLFIFIWLAEVGMTTLAIRENLLQLRFGFVSVIISGRRTKGIDIHAKLI